MLLVELLLHYHRYAEQKGSSTNDESLVDEINVRLVYLVGIVYTIEPFLRITV